MKKRYRYRKPTYSEAQEAGLLYSEEKRRMTINSGVCPVCKLADIQPGENACDLCKSRRRDIRAARRQDGICTNCGRELPEGYKWKTCEKCRRKGRRRHQTYEERHGKVQQGPKWRRVYIQCHACLERRAVFAGWRQDGTGARRGHEGDFLSCEKCGAKWVRYEKFIEERNPEVYKELKRRHEAARGEVQGAG